MVQPIHQNLFCPKCGAIVEHKKSAAVGMKGSGTGSGAAIGAKFGAGIGLAGGPLGAMAGTVPGAIIGAMLGYIAAKKLSNPKCQKCKTKFSI